MIAFIKSLGGEGETYTIVEQEPELGDVSLTSRFNSALGSVALLACSVMQPLLRRNLTSRVVLRIIQLTSREDWICETAFDALLKEGRCVQDHLKRSLSSNRTHNDNSRLFDHLMSEGEVSMALRLLSNDSRGGVLSFDSMIPSGRNLSGEPIFRSARDILQEKYPMGRPANPYIIE